MMDRPEHSSYTGEGREGGMKETGGDTEKMEICIGRKVGGRKRRLEETSEKQRKISCLKKSKISKCKLSN